MTLGVRRPGVWGPSAGSFLFAVVLVIGAPETGSKVFLAVLAAATGYWFVRAWRAGATLTDDSLVVRGQTRTRRLGLIHIRRAVVEPMRTASPLQRQFPYVALAVDLDDGTHIQFEELSAAASDRRRLDDFAASVNARLGT